MTESFPGIALSAGNMRPDHATDMVEAVSPGLKLGLVLNGRFGLKIDGRADLEVAGPELCLLSSQTPFEMHHALRDGTDLHYVTLALDQAARDDLLGDDGRRLHALAGHGDTLGVIHGPARRLVRVLARQIQSCPFQGGIRQTYLTAKALELLAVVTADLLQPDHAAVLARPAERDKIIEARRLLCQSLDQPPTLASLARVVGLNVRRLTEGFREMFGCSIGEFLIEHRMQEGYRLLAAGGVGVAETAYRLGLSPNHFSTAFRKRFGVAPSRLKG